ncbi:MAG: alpha/beta hydrolase [Synechococcales cyanobacterium C42_A2020_086]|jgi:pimeloyl-ACP methyl ester carboxylesterase|nr:alpha/beta hydrolase [Synechococcales cyanobacterium C42_A2020_086]
MITHNLEKSIIKQAMVVSDGSIQLKGDLAIPEQALGMIVLAGGSGSHRHHHSDRYIARALHQTGLATCLINLLTPAEEDIDMRTQHYRFDVRLLSRRLLRVTEGLRHHPETSHLKVGYFCADAESAAALLTCADHPNTVHAIVSRSGRTDLVGSALGRIKTPTLLIVGAGDFPCLGMNQDALEQFQGAKRLEVIPDATHLFEEQPALDQAIEVACHWFKLHLQG